MKKFAFGILLVFWGAVGLVATLAGYGQAVGVVIVGAFMILVIGLLGRIARGVEALKPPRSSA
ncbi:hypothetical protein [Bradyrhizobium vignae]|uniref:hypothetical protein n=1 Tax=Bradyrhizobium vignae TaxID=1549949 RepID=UPI00100B430B|nr:hypothetical protein [Bradyrhizobium vignae]RXG96049.1 hypothetical protein EAV90_23595 [Bradyrhizobium vignae]